VACGGRAHRHATPIEGDPGRMYVEIAAGGSHEEALRAGAEAGLARVRFAELVDARGQLELEVQAREVEVVGDQTLCKLEILVLRLPNDSLLGIARGSARARGTDSAAGDACVERLSASLMQGKVRGLLRRELRARR
jgi:hypothetical protein